MNSPDFGFLNLTMDCNNRCRWCYASPSGFKKDRMKPEDVKSYLDLSRSLGMKDIGFCGGEPTLHSELIEMISYATSLGLRVTLYTNGRRLSEPEFAKRLKKSGVYKVQISIQGTSPEKHDRVTRVPGSYEETIMGIENCRKEGLNMRFLTVLCYDDFMIYKGIIDKFSRMDTPFVFFREIPIVSNLGGRVISNEKSAELVGKIFEYSKKVGARTSFYIRMPLCWYRPELAREMLKANALENLCHTMDGNSLNIDVNGNVLPCLHFVGYPMFSITERGKIMQRGNFLKKWNSKRILRMRTKLRGYPARECVNCKAYGPYCRGGCPLLKFELGPYWKEYQN
jgi:radical SAM protein with 4Fe4S-binding SPASM domain